MRAYGRLNIKHNWRANDIRFASLPSLFIAVRVALALWVAAYSYVIKTLAYFVEFYEEVLSLRFEIVAYFVNRAIALLSRIYEARCWLSKVHFYLCFLLQRHFWQALQAVNLSCSPSNFGLTCHHHRTTVAQKFTIN